MPTDSSRTASLTSRLSILWRRTAEALPGVALALILAVAAHRLIAELIPVVSGLLIAVLAGIALRSLGWVPSWAEPGLRWAAKKLLRAGIVLLGLQLALGDLLGLGWEVLVVVALTVAVTFFGMIALGRALNAPRGMTMLLATGTAICGASAVAAAAAVQKFYRTFDAWFGNSTAPQNGYLEPSPVEKFAERPEFSPESLHATAMIGTPSEVIERLRHYEGLGVTEYSYWMDNTLSHDQKRRSLELFIENVVPAFRE